MADNKTRPTDAKVEDYIPSRASARQRTDCRELIVLFKKLSGTRYGSYRYTYDRGRTERAGRQPSQLTILDCTSFRRSTVMCALPHVTVVTTEFSVTRRRSVLDSPSSPRAA